MIYDQIVKKKKKNIKIFGKLKSFHNSKEILKFSINMQFC